MTFNTELWNGQAPGAAGGYAISRSIRLNSADSAYLSRTPSTAGNRKTWTWAGWVKRSSISDGQWRNIFMATTDGFSSNYSGVMFWNDAFCYLEYQGSLTTEIISAAVFRDPSAWYHLVCAVDTTQATAANRVKLYVNGLPITSFSSSTYPSQNLNTYINFTTVHSLAWSDSTYHFNGYLADVHFIDGQALDPTSFGAFDATTGVWNPIAYTGSFPGNSFHLDFADNSSAAALGTDTSGNGNTWTVNNISVAAGAGNDSLVDSPTNYGTDTGAGGEVRANYATFNPLNAQLGTGSLTNGNLDFTGPVGSSAYNYVGGTFGIDTSTATGFYFEITQVTYGLYAGVSLLDQSVQASSMNGSGTIGYGAEGITYRNDGYIYNYGATTSGLTTWQTSGDIISVAIKDNKIWFAKNGVWISGSPSAGTSPSITLASTKYVTPAAAGLNSNKFALNAGQRAFAYSAPSGYTALCTQNLPTPTIEDGSTAMDVVTYTGNGSTQTISGLNFSPDFIWTKGRNNTEHNTWVDVLRPTSRYLYSSLSAEESPDQPNGVTSFNSDGYSIGSSNYINRSAYTYVGWCWDAGSSNATNTDGSITSTVRANASAGISIISYTGTGTAGTIGHGLGVTPGMVIVKGRGITGTSDAWATYMTGASATAGAYLLLEKQSAVATSSVVFNSTNPTSSVFSVGTWNGTNKSGVAFIAYAFAPVSGFSAFGKYTGNGNADGPFVYTGFRPRFILAKVATAVNDWFIYDTERESFNVMSKTLYANASSIEDPGGYYYVDILSNGFKLKNTYAKTNGSGQTYVYAAFAENPFSLARAR